MPQLQFVDAQSFCCQVQVAALVICLGDGAKVNRKVKRGRNKDLLGMELEDRDVKCH